MFVAHKSILGVLLQYLSACVQMRQKEATPLLVSAHIIGLPNGQGCVPVGSLGGIAVYKISPSVVLGC